MTTEAPAQPASASPTPAPGNPSPLEERAATAQGDGLTQEQHRTMVLDGLRRGVISQERANAELKLAGAQPLTAEETEPRPNALDLAATEDMPPGFETGRPQDFKLPDDLYELDAITAAKKDGTPGKPPLSATERVELQNTIGGYMAEAGLPPPIGAHIAKEAGKHIREFPRYEQMEQGAKDAHRLGELAKLQNLWGPDAVQKNVDLARGLVAHVESKRPGLVAALERSGLGNSAAVIIQLANQARRMAAKNS